MCRYKRKKHYLNLGKTLYKILYSIISIIIILIFSFFPSLSFFILVRFVDQHRNHGFQYDTTPTDDRRTRHPHAPTHYQRMYTHVYLLNSYNSPSIIQTQTELGREGLGLTRNCLRPFKKERKKERKETEKKNLQN